jgi:hypothetical protein
VRVAVPADADLPGALVDRRRASHDRRQALLGLPAVVVLHLERGGRLHPSVLVRCNQLRLCAGGQEHGLQAVHAIHAGQVLDRQPDGRHHADHGQDGQGSVRFICNLYSGRAVHLSPLHRAPVYSLIHDCMR